MEVGAVKQAFNNELIFLKKKLNQARIQIIHKLTRKAKTFAEKKVLEKIKEKLKRKAQAAVNEVLIIKKIKPKDLARFIVTHKAELNTYLNRPNVDQDKACARLLLHKALQEKYKFIRDRFSSVPIEDLLMSREERKNIKKEAREKQKNKKKGKGDNKVVNAEGDWDVEDVEMPSVKLRVSDNELSDDDDDNKMSDNEQSFNKVEEDDEQSSDEIQNEDQTKLASESDGHDDDDSIVNESGSESNDKVEADDVSQDESSESGAEPIDVGKFVKVTPEKPIKKPLILSPKTVEVTTDFIVAPKNAKKIEKKPKDKSKQEKNKNLNEKLLSRKFKKDVADSPIPETKVVDPFFITSTGENYLSVVEPRQPDEVKEEHKQGNRKLRRAVMFGHVPKFTPRRDNNGPDNNRFNRNNGLNKNDSFKKFNNREEHNDGRNFKNERNNFNKKFQEEPIPQKEEKLHPSWEAKKKQSGILPFQGKKIVFNES